MPGFTASIILTMERLEGNPGTSRLLLLSGSRLSKKKQFGLWIQLPQGLSHRYQRVDVPTRAPSNQRQFHKTAAFWDALKLSLDFG